MQEHLDTDHTERKQNYFFQNAPLPDSLRNHAPKKSQYRLLGTKCDQSLPGSMQSSLNTFVEEQLSMVVTAWLRQYFHSEDPAAATTNANEASADHRIRTSLPSTCSRVRMHN